VARSAGVVPCRPLVIAIRYARRMQLHNRLRLKATRQKLRNAATFAEATLWEHLKGKQLAGRKFRRQHSIGPYVVDFYCPAEKLAVELDGSTHDNARAQQRDVTRDAYLAAVGIRTLRIPSKEVMRDVEAVVIYIAQCLSSGGGREMKSLSGDHAAPVAARSPPRRLRRHPSSFEEG